MCTRKNTQHILITQSQSIARRESASEKWSERESEKWSEREKGCVWFRMCDVIHSRIFVISLAAEAENVHVIVLAYIILPQRTNSTATQ